MLVVPKGTKTKIKKPSETVEQMRIAHNRQEKLISFSFVSLP